MQTAIQLTDQQLTHLLVRAIYVAKQLATASSAIYKTVRHYVSKCFFSFFQYRQQHWKPKQSHFLQNVVDKQKVNPLLEPHNTAEEIILLLLTYT